ncbi:hypothetical protein M378DRAFT_436725 [Amanita muscaria Koide BX008]|uniref:Uncharacterized protein n=1 Tax=Amanita muscaria (strain Koide BX008) TaxID=946122 RepID=A0A0C2WKX1_AMAMK|nr:hypothetical protein M378DRAFT_436725 [Amanita muscaria Koide BX008]
MTLCGCCDSASKVDQAEEEGWKKIQTTCPATDDAAQHERNAIQSFTVHVFGLIPDTDVGKARIGFTCMRLEWSCRRRSFSECRRSALYSFLKPCWDGHFSLQMRVERGLICHLRHGSARLHLQIVSPFRLEHFHIISFRHLRYFRKPNGTPVP